MTPQPKKQDAPGAEPRKRTSLRKKLLVTCISCATALLVMEFTARLKFGAPISERLPIMRMQAHPTRGWQMVPSEDHYTYLKQVEINALGLRGDEVGPKLEDERRILVLGDSLTYGQGTGEQGTLPFFLEQRLQAIAPGSRSWSVINAGHRAYDTRQEIALLEELGRQIEPDIVVLNWFWNDLIESDIAGQNKRLAEQGTLTFDIRGKMEGAAKRSWQTRQLLRKSALFMALHDAFLSNDAQLKLPDPIEPSFESMGRLLDRLIELADEMSFVPLVVVLPDPLTVNAQGHFLTALGARVEALARERSMTVLNPLTLMNEECAKLPRLPIVPHDGHYDEAGNRILGRAIADAILPLISPK
jgi:lysophospholipase L1-like esterase